MPIFVYPLVLFTVFGLGLVAGLLMTKMDLKSIAVAEGRRRGLKEAIVVAQERGDVAALVAPKGELVPAMIRAQTAHQIEADLRDLLARAG